MFNKIIKNTAWLVVAQSIAKIFSFFYAMFLARSLGVENFGLYTVALTYFAFISSFADFGVSRYIIREAAKNTNKLTQLLSAALVFRLLSIGLLYALFVFTINLVDSSSERILYSQLAMLAVFPQALALTLDTVFVVFQRLSFSAIGLLILNFSTWVLGFILLTLGYGTSGAIYATLIGQTIYALLLFLIVLRLKINIFRRPDFYAVKTLLLGSLPYGLLTVIGIVSFKMDVLLIAYLKGNYQAGVYSVAYRFLEATTFIPIALSIALSPVIAKLYIQDVASIKMLYLNSLKAMLFLGLVCFLGIYFVLPFFITSLLPEYYESLPALRVLSFAIVFIFLHIPSSQVLLSSDRYLKKLLFIYLSLLLINLILYLIFIPIYGFIGAAWVTVFSEVLTFVAFFSYLILKVLKNN